MTARQQGFTLIEILVAFMVLTLTLTVVFRIFSEGLRNVQLSSDYSQAVMVAESQLTATGVTTPLEIGEASGAWDERFHWQRVIETYQPWEEQKELTRKVDSYRVTVNVAWDRYEKQRRLSLSSIRLGKVDTGEESSLQ